MSQVLVTGGSGFIAGHVILQLLEAGHSVRTTVRTLGREVDIRGRLERMGMTRGDALTFVEADLLADDGWADAVRGVEVVLHIASPVQMEVEDEDALLRPAREGTQRVLRAAREAGVRRAVLTSAFHAVGFGHGSDHGEFTEDDWSVADSDGVDAYGRSKIAAERAAWDLVAEDAERDDAEKCAEGMELVVLAPVAVMGPVLGEQVSGANQIIQRSLNGAMSAVPNLYIPIVDVRDVAAAHVAAIDAPDAAGLRILVGSGEPAVAMVEIGAILREWFGEAAAQVPVRVLPDQVVRQAALTDPGSRVTAHDLGVIKRVSTARLRSVLGIAPRPAREAVIAAGRSLLEQRLVDR